MECPECTTGEMVVEEAHSYPDDERGIVITVKIWWCRGCNHTEAYNKQEEEEDFSPDY